MSVVSFRMVQRSWWGNGYGCCYSFQSEVGGGIWLLDDGGDSDWVEQSYRETLQFELIERSAGCVGLGNQIVHPWALWEAATIAKKTPHRWIIHCNYELSIFIWTGDASFSLLFLKFLVSLSAFSSVIFISELCSKLFNKSIACDPFSCHYLV